MLDWNCQFWHHAPNPSKPSPVIHGLKIRVQSLSGEDLCLWQVTLIGRIAAPLLGPKLPQFCFKNVCHNSAHKNTDLHVTPNVICISCTLLHNYVSFVWVFTQLWMLSFSCLCITDHDMPCCGKSLFITNHWWCKAITEQSCLTYALKISDLLPM